MVARCLNTTMVESNPSILTSLAHAFCYLISSLTDINSAIQQRTVIYLQTIKQNSIRVSHHVSIFQFLCYHIRSSNYVLNQ